jgi:hypothetical protein
LSIAAVLIIAATMVSTVHAGIVTFGSGLNQFTMEFVTIGSPGNAPDTTGVPNPAGAVAYEYGIGKFEVSRDMITKFNASQSIQVSLEDMTAYGGNGANRPAAVTWNGAARFVNWLNTSTGNQAAYKFTTGGANDNIALWAPGDAGYDPSNRYRNSLAKYFLPNSDELYKAAYYNPNDSTYYDFANGSNTAPSAVPSGTAAGTAVYGGLSAPADVTQAGGLSPYGVMGLNGNVWEFEETSADFTNSSGSALRGFRGGSFTDISLHLQSSSRNFNIPTTLWAPNSAQYNIGFRVATLGSSGAAVPEPSSLLLGTLLGLGGYIGKRRLKK